MKFEVEKIVNKRRKKNKTEYLVKWVGFSESQNTWEPLRNLKNVLDIVEEFNLSKKQHYKGRPKKKGSYLKNALKFRNLKIDNGDSQEENVSIFDDEEESGQKQQISKSGNSSSEQEDDCFEGKSEEIQDLPLKSSFDDANIKISEMTEENGQFLFKIRIEAHSFWVKKNFFIPYNLLSLLEFYQSHLFLHDNEKK